MPGFPIDGHIYVYTFYWQASETVLGVDNAKSGICYMYICMWDGTYAI